MRLTELSNRVKDRLFNIFSKHAPIDTKNKPKGIVSLKNLNGNEGVHYYPLNPPYTSELNLPPTFIDDCPDFNKPLLSVNYPGDFVVSIINGRIYNIDPANIAVMSGDNLFIEDLSFQWTGGDGLAPSAENFIFTRKMFGSPKKYPGTVFSLLSGGGAIEYYYHWAIDSIPKLFLLKQSGFFDQVDYFLVPNYTLPFQKQYLAHFGIDESKVINANKIRHIQADRLIVTSYIRIMAHLPKWVPECFYRSFITEAPWKANKLIYVARGDAAINRKVLNEDQVIQLLKPMGFEIWLLTRLSVEEQARLFSSAEFIVASHGGGLTNLVFCQPGTKVLEFFPSTYLSHLYCDICVKRGLRYEYIVYKSEEYTGNDLHRPGVNVTVDLQALEAKVKALLAER